MTGLTDADMVDTQESLIGVSGPALRSVLVSDDQLVFSGAWHSAHPRPRFGQQLWEVIGADPTGSRTSWLIDFSDMSPEWSLITRELLYVRANSRRFRHRIVWHKAIRPTFRPSTISSWQHVLGTLERLSGELGLGLPVDWGHEGTERLRELIQERSPWAMYGTMVSLLHQARDVLTLGGLRFDPTHDIGVAEWAGDTTTNRELATQGLDPETFRAVVGDALAYVDGAPDILHGVQWLSTWTPDPLPSGRLPSSHPVRLTHPHVTTWRQSRLQAAIDEIEGIPTATVARRSKSNASVGEPCLPTLRLVARLPEKRDGSDAAWVQDRVRAGVPLVRGGLPVPISAVTRADGSSGRWRLPFCAQSIGVEAQTLQEACKIICMAFTAMRDSELAGISRTDWRTTWHGADAITSPLVKNANGEPMKWWATPPVIRACEILEELADPKDEYLFRRAPGFSQAAAIKRGDAYSREGGHSRDVSHRIAAAANWESIQHFVWRLNTDESLLGFLPIPAGWSTERGKDDSLPLINPRRFRFTLASISNFVGLGDIAFQRQSKHALVALTHSYAANGATNAWGDLLNTIANREANDRIAKTLDIYQKEWAGEGSLAGHAGRELTRTVRSLLDGLPLGEYDPEADDPQAEQFRTQVMQTPELAAAIKSTAAILHPGSINHCLRYVPQMECTDGVDPMQGLCHPETCRNVLIEQAQQPLWRHRHGEVTAWLGMPRIPPAQKAVLERSQQRLEAQLRTVDG
ncbi:hypothetical protein QOZ88_06340 [Blastococcus sp. BMG 814]|uniref:Integrase n=1 Tax=Blastococcus carthaginiensis TaxID=3050034 RepID=A0ABT9I9J3_9ACTN|nr:hypothetical protein [Blastococcus carthaginiensis]MDP5182250.1 hypothetical protein [Blastococcus carthaginiensis]